MRSLSPVKADPKKFLPLVLLAILLSCAGTFAQGPQQLSLADLLIGLRSKKVALPERNQILAGAVVERGITFSLTPEIEKELMTTGADTGLIQAIKTKSTIVNAAMSVPPKVEPKPVSAAPPPPDAEFYKKRGNDYIAKGEFDLGIVDLNKVFEMKKEDASVYVSRATGYSGRKRHDLAIADLNKAIELDPKQAVAFFRRGEAYELSGDKPKAMEDYKKASDLEPANEPAKTNFQRLQAELKPAPKPVNPPETVAANTPPAADTAVPDVLNLGQISSSMASLAMPVYPNTARQMGIEGKVIVQVNLDEEGKVTYAKATSGAASLRGVSEDAAKRSKFTAAKVNNKAVKATGYIVYNFVSKQ